MFVMSTWRGCGDKKRPWGSALKLMTLAAQAICGTKAASIKQSICVLGAVVAMKALSSHYDFSSATALAAE
jgi:hypothetical protein